MTGVQPVGLWQTSQERVVTKWVAGLPVAVVPLWQLAQAPGVTPVWVNMAGIQVVVR